MKILNFMEKVPIWWKNYFFAALKFCFDNFFASSSFSRDVIFQFLGKWNFNINLRMQKSGQNKIREIQKINCASNLEFLRWNFHKLNLNCCKIIRRELSAPHDDDDGVCGRDGATRSYMYVPKFCFETKLILLQLDP